MSALTHRERLVAALEHRAPDRVPIDFATGGTTSPVPEFYAKLAAHYQLAGTPALLPHMLRLCPVAESILVDLDVDTRPVYMGRIRQGIRPCSESAAFYDEWGVKWREIDTGLTVYRELAESPLADATLADLEDYPWWPDPLDPDRWVGVRETAEQLYHGTDYAVVGCPGFNGVWERACYLCGFERMFSSLVLEPEFVHALLRRLTTLSVVALGRFLELAGPYIQVIKMGDDLGSQQGPLMSPRLYRGLIKPYHAELFGFVHQRTAARVFLHTCGSVYRLLPDLVDVGVDILNPVQVSAAEMDTRRLKAEFGDRLSFWGAIDTQHILPYGTPEDVACEVERRIADLGPGGGYVLASVHNVQADVPVENLLTMYRHARTVGRYPLK